MSHDADDSGFYQPSLGELIPLREAAELSGLSAGPLVLGCGLMDLTMTEEGFTRTPPEDRTIWYI